jgi:hypothetical protein
MMEPIDLTERIALKNDGFVNAMLMLKEMDFEDFKGHVCWTLHKLLTDVKNLQSCVFLMSLSLADLRGKPLDMEGKHFLAEQLAIDLDKLAKDLEG